MLILLINSSSIWNVDVILELQWPSWDIYLRDEATSWGCWKNTEGFGHLMITWSFWSSPGLPSFTWERKKLSCIRIIIFFLYLRIGVWLFQWLFLCSLSFWHFVWRTVWYKRDYVRFHANLGKILKITGINYGPSPFLLQPISSVPTFGKSTYPLFCPCLSMLGREVAQSRMGDHLQGSARSRTLPLTFFFL